MFDSLAEKLGGVFDRLSRRGALREADVDEAMREIRIVLPIRRQPIVPSLTSL